MDKIRAFLYRRPVAYVVGVLAFFNPFLFYLSTDFHGCFDDVLPGLCPTLTALQILLAVGILGLLFVRNLGLWQGFTGHNATVIAYLVAACFTVLLTVANAVILILLSSSIPMARYYFAKEAPFMLGFGFAVSLAFVVPRLVGRKVRIAIVAAVYVLCGLLLVAAEFWAIEPFAFEAEPVVFDTGEGYSVVWATTDVSSGYLTYTVGGVQHEVADANYGRLSSARTIHHVNVPYEALDGNTYTIHATRMLDNEPYFARRGKTITLSRTFKGRPTDDVKMAAITDNHCFSRTKFGKVRQDDYNVVLMLGDFSDFVHQELDITDFLLYPAGALSHGEVPVLYAKGNHDTHSEMGADLAYLLGYDRFYYRVTYGDYTFTVLDSGSCNVDLEEEKYAGVGRYVDYREQQLDWLSACAVPSAGYDVAVVHVWDYASVAEGIHDDRAEAQVVRYNACLQAMGCDLQLSGHKHDYKYFAEGVDGIDVPMVRCGGIQGGLIGHTLTYTVIELKGGNATFTAYDTGAAEVVGQDALVMH